MFSFNELTLNNDLFENNLDCRLHLYITFLTNQIPLCHRFVLYNITMSMQLKWNQGLYFQYSVLLSSLTVPPVRICQLPNIADRPNLVIVNRGSVINSGERLRFQCRGDFRIQGSFALLCQEGGSYEAEFPICVRKEIH